MITRELITQGINKGFVRFIPDSNLNTGTVCQIGESWFYFGGTDAESEMPGDFLNNSDKKEIVNSIYDTLEEFRKYENQDEYAYYDAYLNESLKRNKMKKIMETSRYEEAKKLMHLIEEVAEYYHDNGSEKNAGVSESYYKNERESPRFQPWDESEQLRK